MKNALFAVKWSIFALILFGYNEIGTAEVNYDTAWTFVYDGGVYTENDQPIGDDFRAVKSMNNGNLLCVGSSSDADGAGAVLLMKFDAEGKVLMKRMIRGWDASSYKGTSLCIAQNGDYLIGALRYAGPWVVRTDTTGLVKWATFYFDSVESKKLLRRGYVNSIKETSNGSIICAVGDLYPNNNGYPLNNYAAFMKFDSSGNYLRHREWDDPVGYEYGGFSIEETETGAYIMAGNQTVEYLDTNGGTIWTKEYTFSLDGVGTVANNVNKAKMLRNGKVMIVGQAYEGNCWTRYQEFYYDAWWTPISYAYGVPESWDTAGARGSTDYLYDFAQLGNGNLVFVGNRGDQNGGYPAWVYVTDSTGKHMLWENEISVPKSSTVSMFPYSVASAGDSAFVVCGKGHFDSESGANAFAMYFVPKPVSSTIKMNSVKTVKQKIICKRAGASIEFRLRPHLRGTLVLQITNTSGRQIARLTENSEWGDMTWNTSNVSPGVYFYSTATGASSVRGSIIIR